MNALQLLSQRDQMKIFQELKGILEGFNLDSVAAIAKVSPVTLHYWLTGATRFPHLRTVVKVAYALGYELRLVQTGKPRSKSRRWLRAVK